jgi:hypothetical protein
VRDKHGEQVQLNRCVKKRQQSPGGRGRRHAERPTTLEEEIVAELDAGHDSSAGSGEAVRQWAQEVMEAGTALDLDYRHINALIADLGGPRAEHAAASLWAQSMMNLPEWLVRERRMRGEHSPLGGTTEHTGLPGPERGLIIAREGAVGPLVGLLGSSMGREAEYAAGALGGLSVREENPCRVVSAGAVAPLITLLGSDKGNEARNASQALVELVRRAGYSKAFARARAIAPFVDLLCSSRELEATVAATALEELAYGEDNQPLIAAIPWAIPRLAWRAMGEDDERCKGALTALWRNPELTEALNDCMVRTRSVLARLPTVKEDVLEEWCPAAAAEIRGYGSFDAWKVHVKRCDDRLLLLSWRRGVVEAGKAQLA